MNKKKQTTGSLRKLVVAAALKHVGIFDDSDWVDDEDKSWTFNSIMNEKLWKRYSKAKLKNMDAWLGESEEIPSFIIEDIRDEGFEFVDFFDETLTLKSELDPECISRYFINTNLEDALDGYIITDPTDTKALCIFWHSD